MFQIAAFADEADKMLKGQIEAMKKNGIHLLEARGIDGVNISDLSLEKAREVRAMLDDADIQVWSVGSPIGKVDVNDDFNVHLDKFMHTLDVARILGAKRLRMFSFYHEGTPVNDTLLKRVLVRLNMLLEKSAGSGVVLCHENEKGIYGDTAARCLEIHRQLPQMKAVFDPANFIQCGQNVLEAWEMLHPYVEYLHIKDVKADGTLVPAGMGMGNVPELIRRYGAQGGSVMTLEPHLAVFDGLKELEQDDASMQGMVYASNTEAFDAAANALQQLIKECGI